MTAQANATAILALLNTALSPKVAYDLDDIPSPRPAEYVEIGLSRRFGALARSSGGKGRTGYRVTIRAVSQASVVNARNSLEKSRAALEFARLSVGGETSTPVEFETEDPAQYDEGWFSGLLVFTYVI